MFDWQHLSQPQLKPQELHNSSELSKSCQDFPLSSLLSDMSSSRTLGQDICSSAIPALQPFLRATRPQPQRGSLTGCNGNGILTLSAFPPLPVHGPMSALSPGRRIPSTLTSNTSPATDATRLAPQTSPTKRPSLLLLSICCMAATHVHSSYLRSYLPPLLQQEPPTYVTSPYASSQHLLGLIYLGSFRFGG